MAASNIFHKKFAFEAPMVSSGGNGVTSFDDPTYLGFNLWFNGMSPLFNITNTQGPSAVGYLQQVDPLRAKKLELFIDGLREVNQSRPWYWQSVEGLGEIYKKNAGQADPYVGVHGPGEGIICQCLEAIDLKITALFALYRQAAWDSKWRRWILPENLRHFDMAIDIMEIRNFKRVTRDFITNPINPPIGSDKSEPAANDTRGQRYPTGQGPANLNSDLGINQGGGDDGQVTEMSFVNENCSMVRFMLEECEFHITSGSKIYDEVKNNEGVMASTAIGWSYGNVNEVGNFSGLRFKLDGAEVTKTDASSQSDGQINNDPKAKPKDKSLAPSAADMEKEKSPKLQVGNMLRGAADKAKATGAAAAGQIANAPNILKDTVTAAANSFVQGALLGNAFGVGNRLTNLATNPNALANAALGGAVQTAQESGNSLTKSVQDLGGSIFGDAVSTLESPGGNIFFGQSAPGPEPLGGDENVFPT